MIDIKKYFSYIVLGAMVLGFIFPTPGLFLKPYLSYILMVMMTLSALKIDLRELKNISSDWWRYLVIMIFIFVVPTLVVWLSAPLFSKEIYVGLVVVAAAPSAVAVVFMSDLLGGKSTKALLSTTIAHLLSPLITPLLIWLLIHTVVIVPFTDILWLIVKLVVIPLMAAELIRKIPNYEKLVGFSNLFNTFLLAAILLGIFGPAKSLFFSYKFQTGMIFLLIFIILIIEIIISFWFGRNRSEKITWAVVDTYKNFTLSSVIALNFFGPLALLGSVVYGVVSNLIVLPLQLWLKNNKNN